MSTCLPMPDRYELVSVQRVRDPLDWTWKKQCSEPEARKCAIVDIKYNKVINDAWKDQQEGTCKILICLDDEIKNCDCVRLTNCLWEDLWKFEVINRDKAYKVCIEWMSHREVLLKKCKNDKL